MKPTPAAQRLSNMNALELLSVPLEDREDALARMRAKWYSDAISGGMSHRSAVRWARKTEEITKALIAIVQLRL